MTGRVVTVLGDVWCLGDHRVMCGDSSIEEDIAVLMGGARARGDLVADPR